MTQDRCTVCIERTIGSELFWTHPMELLGAWVLLNVVSVRSETQSVLVQDRCMVCAKRTIGLESFCMHPMVLLGDEALVEAPFGPFGDSANLDAI
jgi:hypothetical protein